MSFSKDYIYPFKELMAIMRRLDRPLYMIAAETEVSDPKCPYCNENRMITLTAPNGQSMTVPCKCGENKHKVYYVIPCRVLGLKSACPSLQSKRRWLLLKSRGGFIQRNILKRQ